MVFILVTESPNTVSVTRGGMEHSARWDGERRLSEVVGSRALLAAALAAWSGQHGEFVLTDEELSPSP